MCALLEVHVEWNVHVERAINDDNGQGSTISLVTKIVFTTHKQMHWLCFSVYYSKMFIT